ncbi:MAG: tetratricopeptide repeat protein [Bacteroidales bacterium]|jgi:AraC-like DNA-binding protein/Tfp pilus assembly protein PilF|nr:tetratricopeptide repeat protein [Bacteroidales bacterium]
MRKKRFFIFILLFSIWCIANGQGFSFLTTPSNTKSLSTQQLLDIGNYYRIANNTDEALTYYKQLISLIPQNPDQEDAERALQAYNWSAQIYYNMGDYRTTYELLLKALELSEAFNDVGYTSRIYSNLGNIYLRFNRYDLAKSYYENALNTCQDSASASVILNNLGYMDVKSGNLDNAFRFLNRSKQVAESYHALIMPTVLHSLATYYQAKKAYDSAYNYYRQSLHEAQEDNNIAQKAESLSDLGKLFFETNRLDSAAFYVNLSNVFAKEHDFLQILMGNYLILSQIAELKGQKVDAFEYFKQYSKLKDSILDSENVAEVNRLQRMYEVSKTDQQMEELRVDQRAKDRTIRYQILIRQIMLIVLIVAGVVLLAMFLQNKKLNVAYKALVDKNLEIIELQKHSVERGTEKYHKSTLSDEMQTELLSRIYAIMDDMTVVCDPDLSIEKLADLVQSNRAYVSQVINDVLKKNFRAFLNDYRIREAQRLFLELDLSKYTIESIALKTGFKSRSTFISAFKEVTGVSPSFYLKSI